MVAREAVGPEGRVVPQQWIANITAPGVSADDRRRHDLLIGAQCRTGRRVLRFHVCRSVDPRRLSRARGFALEVHAGTNLSITLRTQPGGTQRLCVLAAEVGGRWNENSQQLVRHLVRLRGRWAPLALRAAAARTGVGASLVGPACRRGPAGGVQGHAWSLEHATPASGH